MALLKRVRLARGEVQLRCDAGAAFDLVQAPLRGEVVDFHHDLGGIRLVAVRTKDVFIFRAHLCAREGAQEGDRERAHGAKEGSRSLSRMRRDSP